MAKINPVLIYSDIETDSLQATKLLQVSAISEDGKTFNIHLNPHCSFQTNVNISLCMCNGASSWSQLFVLFMKT